MEAAEAEAGSGSMIITLTFLRKFHYANNISMLGALLTPYLDVFVIDYFDAFPLLSSP